MATLSVQPSSSKVAPMQPPPMDFSREVSHSELLVIRGHQPFNAEPKTSALVQFPITPEELVYCRNHGPVQEYDEDEFEVKVRVRDVQVEGQSFAAEKVLTAKDIREKFEMTEVEAALQVCCASLNKPHAARLFGTYAVCRKQAQGNVHHQARCWCALGRRGHC